MIRQLGRQTVLFKSLIVVEIYTYIHIFVWEHCMIGNSYSALVHAFVIKY